MYVGQDKTMVVVYNMCVRVYYAVGLHSNSYFTPIILRLCVPLRGCRSELSSLGQGKNTIKCTA